MKWLWPTFSVPVRMLSLCIFPSLISVTTTVAETTDSPLFVGVLEDVEPGNLSPAMSTPHVRVVFEKHGTEWVPLKTDLKTQETLAGSYKDYPEAVNWTVVFDGKKIGTIASKNPGPIHSYGDIGMQTITTEPALVPRISVGVTDFSYSDNPAKTRPLVLVSAPHFRDPDGWHPTILSTGERRAVIKDFRHRFPSLEQCDKPEEEPVHMVPYLDKEILFLKAFRSTSGEMMSGLKLDDKRSNCGFFDDKLFFDYWFVMNKQQHIRLLGSQMVPMDAVDLDDSGHSEWIFQTSRGEDEDGYALFYDNFNKQTYFYWTYH